VALSFERPHGQSPSREIIARVTLTIHLDNCSSEQARWVASVATISAARRITTGGP
jgi:hypothetical protein